MLAYPFRSGVLVWLLGLSLASVVVQALTGLLDVQWFPVFQIHASIDMVAFGLIGAVLEMFWWLYAFKIAVEAMRAAASGREDQPGRENWADDTQAARQLQLWGGLLLVGYVLFLFFGGPGLSVYCVLLAPVLPAILLLLGMEDSLQFALDPRAWRLLIGKGSGDYLLATVKLTAMALVVGGAEVWILADLPRWLGVPLSRLALLYALVAGYHELGRVLDSHRRRLKLTVDKQPERLDLPYTEADLAMRAAQRYAAEGRIPKAALQLEPLTRDRATTPEVHGYYRELLIYLNDRDRLLRHAHDYLPVLLDRSQDGEALTLYQDSVAVDPAFELEEPRRLSQLIELLTREQQPQRAIGLAQEFLRRFPDEPDAVRNGLAAARQLDRLGQAEDAISLLVTLVRRFPGHPLRGELVAALETLEGSARRGG